MPSGCPRRRIAGEVGLTVFELTAQTASLEEAYITLTSDALDYKAAPAPAERQDMMEALP